MRIITLFLSVLSLNAAEITEDSSDSFEQQDTHKQLSLSYSTQNDILNTPVYYPGFPGYDHPAPSAPPMDELIPEQHTWYLESNPYPGFHSPDNQTKLLMPSPPKQLQAETSREEELFRLKQENKTLSEKIDLMTELLKENNQMLKTIITALQDQGVNLEGLQNGQFQIENDLLSMTGKLQKWKAEIMQSQEHPIAKFLRWFKVGFSVTTSVGTALTTYYTIAWCTSILPAFLTPPGWILMSSSAATGALYYIAYT
jgi:hypothetical protein